MLLTALLAFLAPCCSLSVSVVDSEGKPIAAAQVRAGNEAARTDNSGWAELPLASPGLYTVEASAQGFQTVRKEARATGEGETAVEFILPPAVTERVTVEETINASGNSSTLAPVAGADLKRLPTDPPTLRDALPLIPGIIRTPEGKLTISGSPEYRSTLLVNSLDVTDPGTGRFGATAPIDAVESLNVFRSPFLAEYGRFTAAVVVVDTKRGGDKWRGEVNDPTPELRIRSGHVHGVRAFTPRVSFSGPLIKGKLYLAQSGEYRLNKTPVATLPFPENETWREAWNSLTQFDYVAPRRATTLTLHLVPQKVKFANLSFYMPREVTPNLGSREFNAGITDRLSLTAGVLETGFAASENLARVWPQSDSEMVLTPVVYSGAYFASQQRRGRRYQWIESFTMSRAGHVLRFGTSVIHSELRGWFQARPVNIRDLGGALLERIDYQNQAGYSLRDWESGTYVQDQWQIRPAFSLEYGVRADWQSSTHTVRIAPRAGFSWAPLGDGATVLRGGFGWFFDRAPLSIQAFPAYPEQVIGGVHFQNVLGSRDDAGPLVFGADREGNFAPRSRAFSLNLERRFARLLRLRAGYLESRSEGLVTLESGAAALTMGGSGRARYRQFEIVSRISYKEGQELLLSYARASGRSNLNEFGEWVGDFPSPVVRPDIYGVAPGDTPHRLLLWGVIPFNALTRIAPVIEYRTGSPYSALTASQQYAGEPNTRRFPDFFSVDFKVARDIHVRGHAVQVSFSMFNVTNHWNPDSVRLNTADPQFGEFLGQHRRRFRVDFDFLF